MYYLGVKVIKDNEITKYTSELWKYIEVPQNEPEPHSEYESISINLSESKIIASRVRGKKHKHEGTNCDDWFEIANIGEWSIIAVSDGAGSKKFSRIGAKVSCKCAVEYIVNGFNNILENNKEVYNWTSLPVADEKFVSICSTIANIIQEAIIEAYNSVKKAFEERKDNEIFYNYLGRKLDIKDFSSTLLISVIIPVIADEKKEHLIISCQIGDGTIAAFNINAPYDNALKILSEPDNGSFAGETDFLTSEDMHKKETLMKRTKVARMNITEFMIMTDGVSDDYYPNNLELLRLYLDLNINGIIERIKNKNIVVNNDNIDIIKSIPKPLEYPWVNDLSKKIPIQYIKNVLNCTGLKLKDIWNNEEILNLSSLYTYGIFLSDDKRKEKKLEVWLDNYVERGSFDDRTLVIFSV